LIDEMATIVESSVTLSLAKSMVLIQSGQPAA
jgi:hypothetical protein